MKCLRIRCAYWLLMALLAGGLAAQTNFDIDGMGFFQNRALKSRLAFLQNLEADQPADWDAALIEDSAFLLIEQLKRDGYLQPKVVGQLIGGGLQRQVEWTSPYAIQLEADVTAEEVTFVVEPGKLAYYDEVSVSGASAIDADELLRYFVPGGVLVQTRRSKVFTPENLDRRAGRVVQAMEAMGYREAQLTGSDFDADPRTGAVDVRLEFTQGPRYHVGRLRQTTHKNGTTDEVTLEVDPGTLLTREWEQKQRSTQRNQAYEAGYPDAEVQLSRESTTALEGNLRKVDIHIVVDWGEPVTLSDVYFSGDEATRRDTLRSRLDLESGELLNRLEVDEARRRLMGLGIYKHVAVDLQPETGAERSAVYSLEPGTRKELKLLGGWGSYEKVRAGFKWEHRNALGRAHRYEVEAKQSLKATRATVGYYIPQIFGSDVLLYSNMEYSYREEISYERTNRGVSFGAAYTTADGLRFGAEYGFFREEADRDDEMDFESEDNATVASLSFKISYDQRNDFLVPGSGWSVYSEFTIANRWLGGSVDFQKWEAGGSYHLPLTESTLLHLGLRGGTIYSSGDSEQNIPFNERFFQGGENSVRGFREGEASPLDSSGDLVGAETYALFNLELEQRVYSKFSTVLFYDSVLNAREGFSDGSRMLHSVGLGIRYQTVVGPIRLEYGHNLNPRQSDPDGTLHLSVGFPF